MIFARGIGKVILRIDLWQFPAVWGVPCQSSPWCSLQLRGDCFIFVKLRWRAGVGGHHAGTAPDRRTRRISEHAVSQHAASARSARPAGAIAAGSVDAQGGPSRPRATAAIGKTPAGFAPPIRIARTIARPASQPGASAGTRAHAAMRGTDGGEAAGLPSTGPPAGISTGAAPLPRLLPAVSGYDDRSEAAFPAA